VDQARKVMRSTVLTTANAKAIVDLGEQLGLDYFMYDANWYGRDQTSDATQIRQANLNLKERRIMRTHTRWVRACMSMRGRFRSNGCAFPLFKNEWIWIL